MNMRRIFIVNSFLIIFANVFIYPYYPYVLLSLIPLGPLIILGTQNFFQKNKAILRNFPVLGIFRYFFESIRPEIQQYFIESDTSGVPFNREERSVVYERSKKVRDTIPFGTLKNVYEVGYEWVNHSMQPKELKDYDLRCSVGGPGCTQPYIASRLNISAMSFGALSKNAILSLNKGAKMGNFAHNTGEGGVSTHHQQEGGDLIWQVGTGYFGCRNDKGGFHADKFQEKSQLDQVKMIELKLSQGAKPGHGGILPASKLTQEIALIRGVPMGHDVASPPAHREFNTPVELLQFIEHLRTLSGGKPVGFKLCVGKRREFCAVVKAMLQTGITPDFITVDGGEGGTGAAPVEFANHLGSPLLESLIFVHNTLTGVSLRKKVRVIASGKVVTGFGLLKRLALGADMCNSARAFMMSLGCIQAMQCNSNHCPVGVATQNPDLTIGLVPEVKSHRVLNFHHETLKNVGEFMGAMGITHPDDLFPWNISKRTSTNKIENYSKIYDFLEDGSLLREELPADYKRCFGTAVAEHF